MMKNKFRFICFAVVVLSTLASVVVEFPSYSSFAFGREISPLGISLSPSMRSTRTKSFSRCIQSSLEGLRRIPTTSMYASRRRSDRGSGRGERSGGGRGAGGMMPFMEGETPGDILPPQVIPLKPKSSLGMALRRTVDDREEEFEWTQDEQIKWLSQEKEQIQEMRRTRVSESGTKLVSRKQVQEAQKGKLMEMSKMVVDLLYNMILRQFKRIGVEPIGAGELDGPFADLGPVDLIQLTTGVHTQEALEMVKGHLMSVLGPMMPKSNEGFYTSAAKMPKLQLSQVYMTSVMFGYFLSRVDQRYQVAKKLNMLDKTYKTEEAVKRLQGMLRISKGDSEAYYDTTEDWSEDFESHWTEEEDDMDLKLATDGRTVEDESQQISLKEYVEKFDSKTLVQSASLMSQEAAMLLQEYQYALFGNIRDLQHEMAVAIGPSEGGPAPSADEIMRRIGTAVQQDRVQTVIVTFADQRRLVLEAVAMGGFLREAEDYVQKRAKSEILTPLPPLPLDDSPIKGLLNPGGAS